MSGAVWPPPGWSTWGGAVDAPVIWIGPKRPGANLDYTVDITDSVDPGADQIVGAVAMVAPSGTGELTLSQLTVVGYLVTLYLSGGQPARTYSIPVTVTMANSRVFEFLARVRITPDRITDQPQPAPSQGYGPEVVAILSPPPSPGFAQGVGAATAVGSSNSVAIGLAAGTSHASN